MYPCNSYPIAFSGNSEFSTISTFWEGNSTKSPIFKSFESKDFLNSPCSFIECKALPSVLKFKDDKFASNLMSSSIIKLAGTPCPITYPKLMLMKISPGIISKDFGISN